MVSAGTIFATPVQPGYNSCGTSAINPDTPCPALTQFAPSTSTPTAFGNQTRNQYRGPGYFNTDMSVMKNFKIPRWEAARFGVGFQFFNLFNHPNFDKPINDIAQGPGVFGTIVSTGIRADQHFRLLCPGGARTRPSASFNSGRSSCSDHRSIAASRSPFCTAFLKTS